MVQLSANAVDKNAYGCLQARSLRTRGADGSLPPHTIRDATGRLTPYVLQDRALLSPLGAIVRYVGEQGSSKTFKTARDGPGKMALFPGGFVLFSGSTQDLCFSDLGLNLLRITGFRPLFNRSRWSPEVL